MDPVSSNSFQKKYASIILGPHPSLDLLKLYHTARGETSLSSIMNFFR